jgi:hypothetical protein
MTSFFNYAKVSITNHSQDDFSVRLTMRNENISHSYNIGDIDKNENSAEIKPSLIQSGKTEEYIIPSRHYVMGLRDEEDNILPYEIDLDYQSDYAYYFVFNGELLILVDSRPLTEIGQPDPVFVEFISGFGSVLHEKDKQEIIKALRNAFEGEDIPLLPLFPEEYTDDRYREQVTNTLQVSLQVKERSTQSLAYTELSLALMQGTKRIGAIEIPNFDNYDGDYLVTYESLVEERRKVQVELVEERHREIREQWKKDKDELKRKDFWNSLSVWGGDGYFSDWQVGFGGYFLWNDTIIGGGGDVNFHVSPFPFMRIGVRLSFGGGNFYTFDTGNLDKSASEIFSLSIAPSIGVVFNLGDYLSIFADGMIGVELLPNDVFEMPMGIFPSASFLTPAFDTGMLFRFGDESYGSTYLSSEYRGSFYMNDYIQSISLFFGYDW